VGGDLVVIPGLRFQLQVTCTSHAARLIASINHMPPTLYLVRVSVLQQGRKMVKSREHLAPAWVDVYTFRFTGLA